MNKAALITLMAFILFNSNNNCKCPLDKGLIKKQLPPIMGKGELHSVSFQGDTDDASVYAILGGEVAQLDFQIGVVHLKNDSLSLKYMVIDIDSTLRVGSSIHAGDKIGELNQYFSAFVGVLHQQTDKASAFAVILQAPKAYSKYSI